MEAYLDNSATTQCSQEAADLMMRLLRVDYGNPSSLHNRGMEAENYVKEARKRIAQTLKVNEKEIYFTSGGSESNNLAIVGSALANKRSGMHVITFGGKSFCLFGRTGICRYLSAGGCLWLYFLTGFKRCHV